MFGIAPFENDAAVQPPGLDLAARHGEHLLRKVHAHHLHVADAPRQGDRQVARAGRHVEYAAGIRTPHLVHRTAAPDAVDVHRKRMVQQVVPRRDVVEHLADLLLLGLICVVGFHSYLIVSSGFTPDTTAVGITSRATIAATNPAFSASHHPHPSDTGTSESR